jgi:drug/metabolite transporter (DMT)-like permease
VLAGVACCALYTVLSKNVATSAEPLFIVTVQQSVGLIWMVAIWPFEITNATASPTAALSTGDWLGAVVSGLMYYAAAFWFYLKGLRTVPASVAGGFLNLIPLFTIATAYLSRSPKVLQQVS